VRFVFVNVASGDVRRLFVGRVHYKAAWVGECECGYQLAASYLENAYEWLARHIMTAHGTLEFKIVVLGADEQ